MKKMKNCEYLMINIHAIILTRKMTQKKKNFNLSKNVVDKQNINFCIHIHKKNKPKILDILMSFNLHIHERTILNNTLNLNHMTTYLYLSIYI